MDHPQDALHGRRVDDDSAVGYDGAYRNEVLRLLDAVGVEVGETTDYRTQHFGDPKRRGKRQRTSMKDDARVDVAVEDVVHGVQGLGVRDADANEHEIGLAGDDFTRKGDGVQSVELLDHVEAVRPRQMPLESVTVQRIRLDDQ